MTFMSMTLPWYALQVEPENIERFAFIVDKVKGDGRLFGVRLDSEARHGAGCRVRHDGRAGGRVVSLAGCQAFGDQIIAGINQALKG